MSNQYNGDLVTDVEGDRAQVMVLGTVLTDTVHLDAEVAVETAYMLIDKSNTAVWPHTQSTGYHIVVEYLILEVDPDGSYAGEVKLGFLENVNATNGEFHQVIDIDLRKQSAVVLEVIDFGSHGLQLSTDTHFGPIFTSTRFQTDVNLGGPDDPTTLTYPSGDGDLVLWVTRTAGSVDVSITIGYAMVPDG